MPSFFSRLKQIRWYQWMLAVLMLFYIIYVALSYLYLPGKLKQMVQADVAGRMGRSISVSRIFFNPFALSLGIEEFSVADQPGKPLVGWERLFVNIGFWKSLFKWEIALDEFSITRPEINIEKYPEGFNFSDILQRFGGDDSPEVPDTSQTAEKTRLALEITRTAIVQGTFRYGDMSGATPARSDLDDVTIEVENIYLATGDEQLNPFDLTAKIPGGGTVSLSGRYRIDPLDVDASISAEAVQLAAFSEFLENILPLEIENGLLSFSTRLEAKQETEFQLRTDQGRLEITDLNLADGVPDPPLLRAESISISGAALDLANRDVSVEKVTLSGIRAHQWRDPDGTFRYETLLPENPGETAHETDDPPKTAAPWEMVIHQLNLANGALIFSDQNETTAQTHQLSEMTLGLENVTLTPDEPTALSFSARLDQEGRILVDGDLVLSPFAMDLDYRLEDIQLPPFSKYVEAASYLRVEAGSLSVDGSASLDQGEDRAPAATLNLSVNGIRTVDARTGEALLSLEAFLLKEMAVNTGTRTVSIASVELSGPEINSRISPEKEMNLATLSRPAQGQPPPESEGESERNDDGPAWNVSILSTGISNGAVHFTDRSVRPEFTTGIQDLCLETGPVATNRTDPTPFSLTGKIDQYAPLSVTGTLLPLDRQPGFSFTTTLEGLEMPGFSPYSAAFIGSNLKSGKLSLALDYSLADRKLKGKNNIVAENLYLGEKVPSETAVKAPVALGLALLRDLRGVIDLDVGVAGDLDDPGFSVSGIIAKALLNIIVKAAASPFKLLGALVGGGEELGQVEFAQGAAALTPENMARLKQLSEALIQRPQLALVIRGNASKEEDGNALKARLVLEKAAAARGLTPDDLETETGADSWWQAPENRDALAQMGDALGLPTVSERSEQIQAETPSLQGDALMAAAYAQTYEELVSAQEIDSARLLSLADARALSTKQYLVDTLGLDHQRVSVTKALDSALTSRALALEIDTM